MSLEAVFYVSQCFASVAVVVSLIYLALQVRYAERCQRGLMQQARADRTSNASLTGADPALARIWTKGGAGDSDFTPVELTQWLLLTRAAFLSGEDTILQYKAGLMTKETYETYVAGVRFYMARPGFRAAWKVSRLQFGREFREFTDGILEEVRADIAEGLGVSEWNAMVEAEKRSAAA